MVLTEILTAVRRRVQLVGQPLQLLGHGGHVRLAAQLVKEVAVMPGFVDQIVKLGDDVRNFRNYFLNQ